jgi:hypothetical protein
MVEVKGQEFWSVRVGATKGPLLDLGFDTAASQCSYLPAIGKKQHGGSGFLRCRAARLDHRA